MFEIKVHLDDNEGVTYPLQLTDYHIIIIIVYKLLSHKTAQHYSILTSTAQEMGKKDLFYRTFISIIRHHC